MRISYSTGPRGVVQIDLSVKDIQILNCQFEKIIIDSLQGNALRIQNFTDTPPIIPPLILPLPHPEPDTSINLTVNSTSFKDIQLSGDIRNRGGAAVYSEIGDNGSLIIEDTSFTSCYYIENDGRSINVILNKTGRFETKGTIIFTRCRNIKDSFELVGGHIYALSMYIAEVSTFNFIIRYNTSFTTNEADICGEDIFIYSRNINILNIQTYILFDITTFTNSYNSMFGTEYKLIDELKWGEVDSEECGDVNSTCNSFEHAVLKQTTPDRTPTNLQCGQHIVYTYISVGEMHVNQPYRTEADIFMLGGATTDEISVATERGSVYFDENGEMEFSDQGYWQIKKILRIDYS
ncbi:MAG: hypothetical protein EZS28_033598 [Streblomastix strix]|uniref:Uncharacterized protein n=1 Tax=Streblomastix strix TaxID=222440 RepID=A0A5J4UMB1_9EUKA|nr:MAG: hypothetical protein EZS28_033598 [Streblomastix strix]